MGACKRDIVSLVLLSLGSCVTDIMQKRGKGRPKSYAFEHQVRTILATGRRYPTFPLLNHCQHIFFIHCQHIFYLCLGSSARAARDQLLSNAKVFLREEQFAKYESAVPNVRWFQAQRFQAQGLETHAGKLQWNLYTLDMTATYFSMTMTLFLVQVGGA